MPNDWEIGKFLKVVLALGVVTFASIALDIPALRQVSALVFLSFLPGVLILRVLGIHRISPIESILYSVGLSLTFLMFIGLMANVVYPAIGILRPISTLPLIITIGVMLLVLCLLVYWRDKGFSNPIIPHLKIRNIFSPPVLFLLLLPVLTVLGAYMVNLYGNSILLLVVIAMIALTVLLIALNRFIPRELYPLAIFMIAISLLFHSSLNSFSLVGHDSRIEYFFYKTVEVNAHWNAMLPYAVPTNSMLSTTILPSIFTSQLGIDGTPLFKVIYQLFFALVPLAVYQAFRTRFGDRTAFLSAVVMISYFEYFGEMPFILKQEIATLFIALLVLVMLNSTARILGSRVLFLAFTAGLIVSHYATSYLFTTWVFLALPVLFWLKHEDRVLSKSYVAVLAVSLCAWYMTVASGISLRVAVSLGKNIYHSLTSEMLTPESIAVGVRLAAPVQTTLRLIGRIWFIMFYFFMAVGIYRLAFDRRRIKVYHEYTAFALASFAILLFHLFVPYGAQSFNVSRVLGITLILLAPMCVIGGETVFRLITKTPKLLGGQLYNLLNRFKNYLPEVGHSPGRAIFIFVIIWLLFQSEFVYTLAQEPRYSSLAFNPEMDFIRFNRQDEIAAAWLSNKQGQSRVTIDAFGQALFWAYQGESRVTNFPRNDFGQIGPVPGDNYIFLRSHNTRRNLLIISSEVQVDLQDLDLSVKDKVYDNGNAQIYK